ncbi:leukotriene B4 receptor 1-like [Danio rerio]|uniref:Leukotriene B4 receptor 1-like n=1 Tax=Danio rerio TaxID=7955 RepID=A0AC58IX20_DANRE
MEYQNISNMSSSAGPSVDLLVSSAVLGLCFVLGVPGNIAVLVLLGQYLKDRSFTPKLMFSLAVSDLMSLLFMPVWIYALLNGWVFGQALCKLLSYIVYWSLYCSVLSVCLLSVQRYLQVLHPQIWATLGEKNQSGMISAIWTLSAALGSYALHYQNVMKKENGLLYCDQYFKKDLGKIMVLIVEALLMFIVPLLSLLCFYFGLHRRVSQSVSFSSHRLTTLSIRIVVTFFIFGIPCTINHFVAIAMPWKSEVLYNATGALFFINNSINPILYAFSARSLLQRGAQQSDQTPDNQT